MKRTFAVALGLATLLVLVSRPAAAGEIGFTFFGSAGDTAYAYHPAIDYVDANQNTLAANRFHSDTDRPGWGYGIAFRWLTDAGWGIELSGEKTRFDVSSNDLLTIDSESWDLPTNGTIDFTPVNFDFVSRAQFSDRILGSVSFGATWMRVEMDQHAMLGIPVGYQVARVPVHATYDDEDWTWNVGGRLDFELTRAISAVIDARYYHDRGITPTLEVPTGEVATADGTGTTEIDATAASQIARNLAHSTDLTDLDLRWARVAVGLDFHF